MDLIMLIVAASLLFLIVCSVAYGIKIVFSNNDEERENAVVSLKQNTKKNAVIASEGNYD